MMFQFLLLKPHARSLASSVLAVSFLLSTPSWQPLSGQSTQPVQPRLRSIAVDEQLAADAGLHVGDTVNVAATPESAGDRVLISAVTLRGADPSEIARAEYRVRLHLDQLETLTGYGDRVDRFAVATRGGGAEAKAQHAINSAAFGFHAYPSREIAVETSRTFQVVSRFHRAIGVITIVASTIFLLCIMLLKVEERRRDVAALRLMGISAGSVMRSVVIEATLVAMLGSALGVGLGALASFLVNVHYQSVYRTPLTFALVTPGIIGLAVGLSLVLGIGAGVLASLRLVRTPPLELFGR
ncbi:MAG: FtsX-like permease family protein [Gemmatimonadaceae bacterium]